MDPLTLAPSIAKRNPLVERGARNGPRERECRGPHLHEGQRLEAAHFVDDPLQQADLLRPLRRLRGQVTVGSRQEKPTAPRLTSSSSGGVPPVPAGGELLVSTLESEVATSSVCASTSEARPDVDAGRESPVSTSDSEDATFSVGASVCEARTNVVHQQPIHGHNRRGGPLTSLSVWPSSVRGVRSGVSSPEACRQADWSCQAPLCRAGTYASQRLTHLVIDHGCALGFHMHRVVLLRLRVARGHVPRL
jgi:hypothetical protein